MTKKVFYVDVPNPSNIGKEEGHWIEVGKFRNQSEAVKWIRENIDANCDDEGKISLISKDYE